MPSNALNHNKTLAKLACEVKLARFCRRWGRSGRNGETNGQHTKRAARAYNRAVRKASKLQLSRYQTPATPLDMIMFPDFDNTEHWDLDPDDTFSIHFV